MEYLNYDRVKARFLSVTGMPADEFTEGSIFDNAEQFVLSHLSKPPEELDRHELKLCEYAAAAVAVYDHCMILRLTDRPVMSETGKVTAHREQKDIMQAAAELRREAFGQLTAAGIAAPLEFAFIEV